MSVVLNTKHVNKFMDAAELSTIFPQVKLAHELLESRQGPGNEFLGWMDLPVAYDKAEFARIKQAAAKIRSDSEVLVVIGIGGSYLGARAAIEALKGTLYNSTCKGTPQIFYVGNSISATYLQDVLAICEGRDVSVNIISKSGTTTEPAVAFRVFKALLEKKYGKDGARGRIYATTDKARGTLKELADREGYESFVVPDDVGGRYSVLTAVGLLPIAAAGCDIDALMAGAAEAREKLAVCDENNDCYRYAAMRNILYRKGKSVELMACYEPNFTMMNEWYKQLFGESEGKNQKGLFPASVIFSTDLHSMGQFVQDGARIMFETVVDIKKPQKDMFIEKSEENFDGLNFLSGQNMSIVNRKAM
ncbi:MAG: glucose-6-phosphate isomerase, partial [Ruthenibacterium sp.]